MIWEASILGPFRGKLPCYAINGEGVGFRKGLKGWGEGWGSEGVSAYDSRDCEAENMRGSFYREKIPNELSQQKLHKYILILYNIDKFSNPFQLKRKEITDMSAYQ